jgi:hypothetical protein
MTPETPVSFFAFLRFISFLIGQNKNGADGYKDRGKDAQE